MSNNNKDNFLQSIVSHRTSVALLCILLMFAGFLWSRALLSMSMMALAVVSVAGTWTLHPLRNKYWVAGMVWIVLLAITGFWSDDKTWWGVLMQVKIPIIFLTATYFMLPAFTVQQKKIFTLGLMLMAAAGMSYTLYIWATADVNWVNHYGHAKVLPTLADKDHIRFSMSMILLLNWCIYFAVLYGNAIWRTGIVLFGFLVFFFLHVLAVRTGLLTLYFSIIIWLFYVLFKIKWWKGFILLGLLAGTIYLCYQYIPTVKAKVAYTKYTWELYFKGNRSAVYSDIGRWVSIKAGWHIASQHPVAGVGLGDVLQESKNYYSTHLPDEESRNMFPHNEILLQASAGGLLVLIPFMVWLLMPLQWFKKTTAGFLMISTWVILFFACMIEPLLEVQIGVFVYLFFLLWCMKEVYDEKRKLKNLS